MSENLDKNLNEETSPVTDQNVGNEVDFITEEESTIFSAPAEHKDKAPKANSANVKRIASIISACLAVAILVVGTLHIIKNIALLTENETPQTDTALQGITLIEEDSETFKTVTIINENGEFKLKKMQISATDNDGNTNISERWTVDGEDYTKLSNVELEEKVSAASEFIAICEIDKLSDEECGLDKPTLKITVENDSKYFNVLVGKKAPDNSGSYVKVEGNVNEEYLGKIYLVSNSYFSDFYFDIKNLADTTSIPATVFETDTSENKAADGSYAYFDSLTISGKALGETVTIVNSTGDRESDTLAGYIVTTPTERLAFSQNLTPFIKIFSETTAVSGCYALDITDETLKEVGLDDPDFVITLTINGESKVFKLTEVEETDSTERYFAVVYDGATMIRKVNISNLTNSTSDTAGISIADYKIEDFYMPNMFMYSIYDLNGLKFQDSTNSYSFDISYDDNLQEFSIKTNGKTVVAEKFQDFYERLINVECSDFTLSEITNAAESKITFTFTDGSQSTIEFYNVTATEYQYSINGTQMGKIPASYYSTNIVNAFATVASQTN